MLRAAEDKVDKPEEDKEAEKPSGVLDPDRMNSVTSPGFGEDVPREVWDSSYNKQ